MKKVISLFLSIVMVISTFACVDLSAYAESSATLDNLETYKAQCFLGIAEDNNSDAVIRCNSLYNYYVSDDIYSPSQSYLDLCYSDEELMMSYNEWKLYSLAADPSSALDQVASREDYYESLIISMYSSATAENEEFKKFINNKVIKNTNKFIGTMCNIAKVSDISKLTEVLDINSDAGMDLIKQGVEQNYAPAIVGKFSSTLSDIISASNTIYDLSQRISLYGTMAELDDSTKQWINQMYQQCSAGETDTVLTAALMNLSMASTDFAGAVLADVSSAAFQLSKWAVETTINEGISFLIGGNPVALAVFSGLKAGKTICNIFFNTDDVCEQLYLMECIYEVESLARKVIDSCSDTFLNTQSLSNAQSFLYAVDCYFEAIIDLDIDCMEKFLDKLYNGGIIKGNQDDYNEHISVLEDLRTTRENNYNQMIAYFIAAVRANYPDDYEDYFGNTVLLEDIEFLCGYTIRPGYPDGYADVLVGETVNVDVIYYPSDTTQTGYKLESSNPDVLKIDGEQVIGISAGMAILTVTSTVNPNIFYSKEIKVGEKLDIDDEENPDIEETPAEYFTYTINDDKVTITGLTINFDFENLIIPSTINDYPVTSIDVNAFSYNKKIINITIPNSVTSIGMYAFRGCTNITNVVIGNGITRIDSNTFENCTGLTSIKLPDNLTVIEDEAFSGCSSLASIKLPDSLTVIEYEAFSGCSSLASVKLPNSLTEIQYSAFASCKDLVSISIPNKVIDIANNVFYNTGYYNDESNWECDVLYIDNHLIEAKSSVLNNYTIKDRTINICDSAFSGCKNIVQILIPNSVLNICSDAFYNCSNLYNLSIPASANINHTSFRGCSNIKDITITKGTGIMADYNYNYNSGGNYTPWHVSKNPQITIEDGVTNIGEYVFENCTELTDITIPDSVTSIEFCAFGGCTALTSITIPDSVTNIGSSAFSYCTGLKELSFPCSATMDNDVFYGSTNIDKITITKGSGVMSESSYLPTLPWYVSKCSRIFIEEGVKTISENAFRDCDFITSLALPNSLTNIGSCAFNGCTSLTNMTIPDSVTSIGEYAFFGCTSLTSVTIGNSVTSIGNSVFSHCASLGSITIPDCATSIGSDAFWNCTSLYSLSIPASANINHTSFRGCSNIKNITITKGTGIMADYNYNYNSGGNYTPWHVSKNPQITIEDGVTNIGEDVFRNCTELTNITIPDSVTSIGSYAFCDCTSLASIIIPDSVTSIEFDAFSGCTALTSITIPDSITSIDSSTFNNCTSLTSLIIPNTVTSIGHGAFYGCTSLTNITIPDSVTNITDDAFKNCASLTSVTIPDSVFVNNSSFEHCPIQTVTIKSGTGADKSYWSNPIPCSSYNAPKDDPKYLSENGVLFNKDKTELIRYPIKKQDTSYEIPNGVTNITDDAFKNCTLLTSIKISDSVTRIGEDAFYNCSSLMNITIPDGITRIEKYAFLNTAYYNDESNWTDGVLYIDDCLIRVKNSVSAYVPKNELKIIAQNAFENDYSSSLIINDFELDVNLHSDGSNSFSITKYTGSATDLIIPKQLYGYDIHSIDEYAFYGCSSLKSIDVQGVEIFGMGVFLDCENLTDVILSNNLSYIEREVFKDCTSLVNITIPDSVTSIGSYAFSGCTSLTSITIPDSITSIGSYTFGNCTSLKNIRIPNNVEFIGSNAFINTGYYNDESNWENDVLYMNGHLIEAKDAIEGAYTVKPGTKSIVSNAFEDCTALTQITIPNSVIDIGFGTFNGCTNLISVTLSDNITCIDSYTFMDCEQLQSITIPEGVTNIEDRAFLGCASLTHIKFPESLENIESYAFGDCTSLTSITIPDKVAITARNDNMLKGCSSLENIFVGENNTSCTSVDGVLYNKDKTKLIQYPGAKADPSYTIPDSVIDISPYAFEFCTNLAEIIVFPENTSYCSADGVLFNKDKTNLLRYPAAKPEINYVIPDTVTDIAECAFFDNDKLECLTISKNVKRIALDYSSIWYSLDAGHPGAFYNNTSLKKIIWNAERCYLVSEDEYFDPESPNYDPIYSLCILASFFPECTEFIIGDEVKYIPCLILANNQNINSINISDSVASVGLGSFYNCTNLASVTISDSITSISNSAFYACESLEDIYYTGSEEEWNNIEIDDYNDNLLSANIHYNVTDEHEYTVTESVNATCTNNGYEKCRCPCGYERVKTNPALGHNFINGVCQNCGMLEADCIESEHPYANNFDNMWTINKPNAKRIAITFSSDTETESCDYIYLYDSDDNQIGEYSGTELAGKRVNVKGDAVKIRLVTDSSVTYYGFAVTNVQVYYEDCTHSKTELRNVKTANCADSGYTGDICCIECDEVITKGEIIPKTDNHNMQERVVQPTCTEQGYTEYYCWNCDYSYKTDYIPATGIHTYINGFCKDCKSKDPDYILPVINSGESQTVEINNGGDYYYVTFTPKSNGTCTFYSTGDYDTYGYLYDENMNELSSNDDGGENYNFSINYDLQAGRTYIFACSMLNSDETGTFNVTLEFNEAEHEHSYVTKTVEPTCTAKGYTTYTCACGDSYVDNYVNATGHTYDSGVVTKKATCTATGIKTYTCTICGETKTETIAKTAHTYKNYVTKATTSKNGSIVNKCSVCGAVKSKSTVYYPKTVTLSTTSYTYDGKVKKPSVKVVGSNGKTISASNYTVSYSSGRKNVGKYNVKVTFKGNYSGTITKTFTIKPKNTSISKITAKSKGFTVKWKKYTTQTTGYQIQYSTSSKFTSAKTVTVSKNSTTSKTISKLKSKKKYYVRIRTYKTVSGTKYYSSWSKAKTVTTKK